MSARFRREVSAPFRREVNAPFRREVSADGENRGNRGAASYFLSLPFFIPLLGA